MIPRDGKKQFLSTFVNIDPEFALCIGQCPRRAFFYADTDILQRGISGRIHYRARDHFGLTDPDLTKKKANQEYGGALYYRD